MTFDFNQTHFQLFQLPATFALDGKALETQYRALQATYHPDRFASADDAQRRLSLQIATQVNEAWQTLKSPVARARYLLQLNGVDTEEETNTAMPMDFLMNQMIWREHIAEGKASQNVERLEELNGELRQEIHALEDELGRLIDDEGRYADAAMAVRKLRFMEKLDQEIGNAIESVLY
ncbi:MULTISPECIES: Fe-S protein assembly co-chaperone HscB [Silvimonas]|uniref:Fe-S protein assembly co-chaperone HscB n=1 Tax=Silvimonas TaxID=300264 RepID=UPI0024B3C018|nr:MULTISPECIES: Fe-S protein assembly co-chaperone HscB [Silvimonas]MDR3426853.1 Fe-S protein assembly co-chaperone HscB [Silvimonas sp.]